MFIVSFYQKICFKLEVCGISVQSLIITIHYVYIKRFWKGTQMFSIAFLRSKLKFHYEN